MLDDFDDWNKIKKRIDGLQNRPPIFHEGDIWWVNIGRNVGVENNGKGKFFNRPVLVLKKINTYSCIVIPMSSKVKYGGFYFKFSFRNKENNLMFNQVRVLDTSRFIKIIGQLSEGKVMIIKKYFINIFK